MPNRVESGNGYLGRGVSEVVIGACIRIQGRGLAMRPFR